MWKITHRILPVFLVVVLVFSLSVPAYAAFPNEFRDTGSRDDWTAALNADRSAFYWDFFLEKLPGKSISDVWWYMVDKVLTSKCDSVTLDRLESICAQVQKNFTVQFEDTIFKSLLGLPASLYHETLMHIYGLGSMSFEVRQHPSSGLYRIYETKNKLWLTDSAGKYPYWEPQTGVTSSGDSWISASVAKKQIESGYSHVRSLEILKSIAATLSASGTDASVRDLSGFKVIYWKGSYLADKDGYPYVAIPPTTSAAINSDRPTTEVMDELGNKIDNLTEITENIKTGIDLSGMTMILPNGQFMLADEILYDASTKTYNIDSHDVTNTNITYNYHWEYHINYTSITYIGQTEEYDKYYECYYELPDGRNSADLTKEELEQLNLDIDVIPYGRSADDTSVRSLYHFDGDCRDASYWNYCTDFEWVVGSSLTYMDSGTFKGALYLDENDHVFSLGLPSPLQTGDFTIQFRLYQSATPTPYPDSFISVDGVRLWTFDGSNFPTGSWNEVALVRDQGQLRLYVNGLAVSTKGFPEFLGDRITFQFGSQQQTFKYLDELRVLNKAIVKDGKNYLPTSVPHDTNLTLVLPTDSVPLADEYYVFHPSKDSVYYLDLTDSSLVQQLQSAGLLYTGDESEGNTASFSSGYWGLSITRTGVSSAWHPTSATQVGLKIPSMVPDVSYDFLIVLYDSNHKPNVFRCSESYGKINSCVRVLGDSITMVGREYWYQICPEEEGKTEALLGVDVLPLHYSELSTWELVTKVAGLDVESLSTATLAVRTDLAITSWQIGGVRPSLPEKGMVWALVESNYISSLQIYNGQAWEAVDGRIWTGERWVPLRSYNIQTLQDMFDIVDSTNNYEYIYTESGFWAWWQKSWNAFQERLFGALGVGSPGGNDTVKDPSDLVVEDDDGNEWSFLDLGGTVVKGIWSIGTGFIKVTVGGVTQFVSTVSDVGNFFEVVNDDGSVIYGMFDGYEE